MTRWEIFNPYNGTKVFGVPFKWIARLITRQNGNWDYAIKGDGWI